MNKLLIAVLSALIVSPALAAGNLKLGPVSVTPTLSTEQRYDDNIYLEKNLRNNSSINETSVGSGFGLSILERTKLDLSYKADFISYSEAPGANNAIHQTAALSLGHETPSGLKFAAADTFMDTTDPAASELVKRERRAQNDATASIGRKMSGGLGVTFDVGHTLHDYSSKTLSDSLDRQEMKAGVAVSMPIGATTDGVIGYHYTRVEFAETVANIKDSMTHDLTIGVDGELASKIAGKVNAGVTMRNYDKKRAGIEQDITTFSYGLAVSWTPTERTTVSLAGNRAITESTFGVNRFYVASSVSPSVTQKIGNKTTLGANATFEQDAYPEDTTVGTKTAKRTDTILLGGVTLDYKINDGLTVGAFYKNRTRGSNFSTFEYADNITGINIKLAL